MKSKLQELRKEMIYTINNNLVSMGRNPYRIQEVADLLLIQVVEYLNNSKKLDKNISKLKNDKFV